MLRGVLYYSTSTSMATPPPAAPPVRCNGQTCPWWPYSSSKDFRTNATMILIILFCLLFCAIALVSAIRYLLRGRGEGQDHPHGNGTAVVVEEERGKDNLSSNLPEEIPTMVFSAGMDLKLAGEEIECTICLSEFTEGDGIRVLARCNHGFHVQCIQKWLTSHSSCPTCRADCLPLAVIQQVVP